MAGKKAEALVSTPEAGTEKKIKTLFRVGLAFLITLMVSTTLLLFLKAYLSPRDSLCL